MGTAEGPNPYDSERDGQKLCPRGFVVRQRELVERSEKCTYPPDCGDCPIRERNLI